MKPGDKVLSDSGENSGLRVTCGASGTKTFYYRYTSPMTGKLAQLKIGNYPLVGLAEARQILRDLKVMRKSGRCPATEKKQQKLADQERHAAEQAARSFSVKDLVDFYLRERIEDRIVDGKKIPGARKPKGQSEVRRTLYNDLVPMLGDRPAAEITRRDIITLINVILERGANVQAGNVLRELSAAFEFAIAMEKLSDEFANPAVLAKSTLRQAGVRLTSQKGKRYLNDNELTRFLHWLPGSVFTPTQKNILRMTLWTGCRTGEICNAEWRDIDLDRSVWHLRETKTDAPRSVQLATQAADFLRQLRFTTGDYPFPSQKTGKPIQQKSLTEQAWHLRQTNRMLDIAHWSPHDLRRTVRTGLSRLGCPNEIAEAVLGHTRGGIEGVYNLHSYESECREWLQKWADHLDRLLLEQ